jgi:quercetin dioxygenase-like cupin family protein
MNVPAVKINFVSNLFVKQMHFLHAGDTEQGHAHCYDHLTLLASGSLRLTALGKTTDFKAPHHIYIKANVDHELVALEDNTVAHCIHALRDPDGSGNIIDPASVPEGIVPDHWPLLVEDIVQTNK